MKPCRSCRKASTVPCDSPSRQPRLSTVPAIETVGGKARYATLSYPDYRPDWEQVRALLGPRTRMIVINSPHNPTGAVWSAQDLEHLSELTTAGSLPWGRLLAV